jgi:hypothetical protein
VRHALSLAKAMAPLWLRASALGVETIKGYPTSSPPTAKWSPVCHTPELSSCPDGAAGHEVLWQLQAALY